MRLAIITTHPVQYYAPVFKLLQQHPGLDIKVFYTWGKNAVEKFDPGFRKIVEWDTPLLDGYAYEWVKNTSADPGSHHFNGIINPGLIDDIKAWQADALLVYGWAYKSHFKLIRYFKNRIPVYFRGDSTLLDNRKGPRAILRAVFLKWVYAYVDHAFYVGSANRAYFKKYGLKDNQLTFAPHAIDNGRFGADKAGEAHKIRQCFGIDNSDVLILFAGKFEEKKTPQLLLDAFITLNMSKTHLLFVGDGIFGPPLKYKAGKHANVHVLGFQNQSAMPAVYQACDLFCLPSKGPGETWGLSVNEAMAAGKPVLVSDKCGCAIDLVKQGVNGEIFESDKADSIVAKLSLLLKSQAELKILGLNAKHEIRSWSFSHQANAILNTLLNEK
jgi:glycosyltransferase involved in cell wall biosynthesis